MFERYTERARRVLFFARYEASQLGGLTIETEHFLLGLLREGKGVAARIFALEHVSPDDLRREIEGRTIFREKVSTSVEIPFSAESKRVLQFAAEEADRLLHQHIGTEHLLLGILREERSVAASILTDKRMRLDKVRDDIVRLLSVRQSLDDASASLVEERFDDALSPSFGFRITRSSRSGHTTSSGSDFWTATGLTLKEVVARLFGVEERRIELPDDLDTGLQYDFVLRLQAPEAWSRMERRVLEGIQHHFQIAIVRERREQDVYVLTAPNGPSSSLRQEPDAGGGGAGGGSFDFTTVAGAGGMPLDPKTGTPASFGNLKMSGLTIADLCEMLEDMFRQPFVDETNLRGTYELAVEGEFQTPEAFFTAMSRQLGLETTAGRRALDVVVVRHV